MLRVLFVCVHNAARSQIAEAYMNQLGDGLFKAESAGLEKGSLNPYVIEVMKEDGFDISNNSVDGVFDFFKEGREYTYVIKVCDEIQGQRCPIFPSALRDIYWNLKDPASFEGSKEEILAQTRKIRDTIKEKVITFIEDNKEYALTRKNKHH